VLNALNSNKVNAPDEHYRRAYLQGKKLQAHVYDELMKLAEADEN